MSLILGQVLKIRIIFSVICVEFVPYFVYKMGDYGRNNSRRDGVAVCVLDSCNG